MLWFWIAFLVLIVALSGFYIVFFYSGFQLKNIMISGNQKTSAQDLRQLVLGNADKALVNFWKIKITTSSIFLINDGKMSLSILQKFPVIEKVEINKNFPQTLTLNIIERQRVGAYCTSTGSEIANSGCFSIDQNGITFESLPALPADISIVRQLAENGQAYIGQQIVAPNIMGVILKIKKSLKDNFQIDLKEALIASPVKLDVRTSENWNIYFDLSGDSDINSQLEKLNLLLNGTISATSRKNLRYINLIPKDRAIICDNSACGG
jgi:hypothetical protein